MNETYRKIAVLIEIENSIKYLRNGLSELQKITPTNDFYDPTLLFLSSGLERLFKTMLCLNFKEVNGRLPTRNEIWNNRQGHDIEFLKSEVEKICIPINRSFTEMDYELITNDSLISSICKTLSEFAQRSRYFNMDVILGNEQSFDSKKEWEELETLVLKDFYGENEFYKKLGDFDLLDGIYEKGNELLVSKLEEFLRAITRQFIFGNFSSESKTFVFQIESFTNIKDEQIGKTDYRTLKNDERIKRK
jgi:hypothetical protein